MKTNTKVKIKYGVVLLSILALFTMTACQPTPDNLIVQSKSNDDLQDAIMTTAVPSSASESEKVINSTLANDNQTITININTVVELQNIDNLPIAYIEPYDLSQERIDAITDVLIGDRLLMDTKTMTKTQIEELILHIKQSATDLNSDLAQSNGIDNLPDLRVFADDMIAEYQKQWNTAPNSSIIYDSLDISNPDNIATGAISDLEFIDAQAIVDFDKPKYASISYCHSPTSQNFWFWNFGENNARRYLESDSKVFDMYTEDEEFMQTKEIALNYFDQLNIDNMVLGNVYICGDRTRLFGINAAGIEGEFPIGSTKEYFVFSFNRAINGQLIDNSFYEGTNDERSADSTTYDKPLPYEYLEIWMNGTEFVQFIWENPVRITDIRNNNVQVQTSLEDSIDIMQQYLFVKYADMFNHNAEDIQINISKINITLARVKERDTGKYLIVPVWDFYGEIKVKMTDENAMAVGISSYQYKKDGDYFILSEPNKSILTVNSLDGSVLNRASGY